MSISGFLEHHDIHHLTFLLKLQKKTKIWSANEEGEMRILSTKTGEKDKVVFISCETINSVRCEIINLEGKLLHLELYILLRIL